MSDDALVTLANNMNRLISKSGGRYSSNEAAQKGSQGTVSRSTFDRLRNIDKAGATSVGIDKLDAVAKTFGVEVWQLFVPNLDLKNPHKLAKEGPEATAQHPWPFPRLDAAKISALEEGDRTSLQAAVLLLAAQLDLDVKK